MEDAVEAKPQTISELPPNALGKLFTTGDATRDMENVLAALRDYSPIIERLRRPVSTTDPFAPIVEYSTVFVQETDVTGTLFAKNLTADSMGLEGGFRLQINGEYATDIPSQILKIFVNWGTEAATSFQGPKNTGSDTTWRHFQYTLEIFNKDNKSAQYIYQKWLEGGSNGAFNNGIVHQAAVESFSQDTTLSIPLSVTIHWDLASGANGSNFYKYHSIFQPLPSPDIL